MRPKKTNDPLPKVEEGELSNPLADNASHRETHRWRLAVRLFIGATMACVAVAGYSFFRPNSSGAQWLASRAATPEAALSQEADVLLSQTEAMGRSLQTTLYQLSQRATATASAAAAAAPPATPTGPAESSAELVVELRELYPAMNRLMARMRDGMKGSTLTAADLAGMAAEMDSIVRRIDALKARRAGPPADDLAAIGARIDDLTRRMGDLSAQQRPIAAGELVDMKAEIQDTARRMNAFVARRYAAGASTRSIGEDMALRVQEFKNMMQESVTFMREMMASPTRDGARVAEMQNRLENLQSMLDGLNADLRAGAGLTSPITGDQTPAVGAPSSGAFNDRMNSWLTKMRADATSSTSSGMMAGMMEMMGGMMGGQ